MRIFTKEQFKDYLFSRGDEKFIGVDDCKCAMTQFGQAMLGDIVHHSTTKGKLMNLWNEIVGEIQCSHEEIRNVVNSNTFREAYDNIDKE